MSFGPITSTYIAGAQPPQAKKDSLSTKKSISSKTNSQNKLTLESGDLSSLSSNGSSSQGSQISDYSFSEHRVYLQPNTPKAWNCNDFLKTLLQTSRNTNPHLYSKEACAKFLKKIVSYENLTLDAFSKNDHYDLLETLCTTFNFDNPEQCANFKEGMRLLNKSEEPNSASTRYFANKTAIANALYTIQEETGYSLVPSLKDFTFFPHYKHRERLTFNLENIPLKKAIVRDNKTTFILLNGNKKELGNGGSSRVRMALRIGKNQALLANKKMKIDTFSQQIRVYREYRFGRELGMQHLTLRPETIFYYGDAKGQSKPNVSILMPIGKTVDLTFFWDENGEVSPQKLHQFSEQTIDLLCKLHKEGYAHCDFKFANLLEKEDRLYLSDLGEIKKVNEPFALHRIPASASAGTYVSPEYALYYDAYLTSCDQMETSNWDYKAFNRFEAFEQSVMAQRDNMDDQKRDVFAWGAAMVDLFVSLNLYPLEKYPNLNRNESHSNEVINWTTQTLNTLERLTPTPLITATINALNPDPASRVTMEAIKSQFSETSDIN